MHISSKGQITIPKQFRDQLELLPGTEVEFEVLGNSLVIRKSSNRRRRGQTLVATMRGTATVKMTTDEIMALTRGEG